jgi:hypothetical protein
MKSQNRALTGLLGGTLVVVAAMVVLASSSVAVSPAKTPTPPDSGAWKVTAATSNADLTGSFVVTHGHRAVRGLKGTIGTEAFAACGTGKLTVLGKQKIIDAKGTNANGHYSDWVVGSNHPQGTPVVRPITVTVSVNGHHRKGALEIDFVGARGRAHGDFSSGTLTYRHSACQLDFRVAKR